MKRATPPVIAFLLFAFSANAQTPYIDSLLRVVERRGKDTTEVKALNQLGIEFNRKDIVRQREFLHKGVTLSKQLNAFMLTAFYSQLTVSHQSSANVDSARFYLELLRVASLANPNNDRVSINYHQTAGLFYKNIGQPKEALPHMQKTLEVTRDSTTRAGMMLNIGNIYMDLGDLNAGAQYHLSSLALFEKVGNKRGQSFAFQGLGNDYLKMKQWKKAGAYFEQSLKLKEQLNDKRGIMTAQGSLSTVNMELGNYTQAIDLSEKSYKLAKEMSLTSEEGRALDDLGLIYTKMGNPDKSQEHYQRALKIARQLDDKPWVASIEATLLQFDKEKKSTELIEAGLLRSLSQYEQAGDKIRVADVHHSLAEFYSKHNDFKKAYEHLNKFSVLEDSTRGESVDARLRALEEEYANEKRDREMALLRKDQDLKTADLERRHAVQAGVIIALISILAIGLLLVNRYQVISRAKRLAEIERMRNAIARDLHDDIGSTLSSINIMSQLAMREGENASKHFTKIAEQSGRMMESMSDIVWSITPGNDSLEHVVTKMKEFAAEILEPKNITYRFTGDASLKDTTLSLEKRKNLFLIFKEAVNNAAKYSGATDLEIIFMRQGNSLSLSVSDNGGGFEPERVKVGNGLKNMKARASALSARFDFVTRLSKGTRVALEVPIT